MKLSDNTVTLLKNFSNINQSILIKKGSQIKTISVLKNIYAVANVEEEFSKDFAIYDLNEFLNGLGLHQDPDLDFTNDSYLTIKEGKRKVKYFYADPEVIVSPPDKDIDLPTEDVCFQLEHSQLDKLIKAASVYKLPDLSAVGETDANFVFNFKVENLKMIPGSYDVVISQKLSARFVNEKYNLKYFIALEPDSTFG